MIVPYFVCVWYNAFTIATWKALYHFHEHVVEVNYYVLINTVLHVLCVGWKSIVLNFTVCNCAVETMNIRGHNDECYCIFYIVKLPVHKTGCAFCHASPFNWPSKGRADGSLPVRPCLWKMKYYGIL